MNVLVIGATGATDRAVEGQDAVLVAFGPRSLKMDDLREVFMRHLVAVMQQHGVKRLVNLSGWGRGQRAVVTLHFQARQNDGPSERLCGQGAR